MGTVLLVCCIGGKVGTRQIVYTPGMLPVVSKDLRNAFLRETMSHTFLKRYQKNGFVMNSFLAKMVMKRGFMVL